MKNIVRLAPALFALCLITGSAQAADPVKIGSFGECRNMAGDQDSCWSAYKLNDDAGPVCYMMANPQKAEGKYSKRGEVAILITHRPSEGSRDVFSFMAGYGYKKGSNVEVAVDGRKFKLFTQNDMAWAADSEADAALAAAIQKGSSLTVSGESARGTKTKDTFSLKGSTKAYAKISAECP